MKSPQAGQPAHLGIRPESAAAILPDAAARLLLSGVPGTCTLRFMLSLQVVFKSVSRTDCKGLLAQTFAQE